MCTNRYTEVPAYVKKYHHITRYIYIFYLEYKNTRYINMYIHKQMIEKT